jgi:hypothetical protein
MKRECLIQGLEKQLTKKEFEFVCQTLGEPTEEVSNCCGANVAPHNDNDPTSRCMECKEGCGVVYVWQ